MKCVNNLASIAAASLLLAGCAGNWDVDSVAAQQSTGDAFAQELQTRYVERAKFEKDEGDWRSVDFFTTRALSAANGDTPAPQPVSERAIPASAMGDIQSAHGVLTAALATSAPQDAPDACAQAQTWLEHWMEQQEEGHQLDHIALARDNFEKAMPQCTAKVAAVEPPPSKFVVHFDFDQARITEDGMAILAEAAKAAKAIMPANIYLSGHTDAAGNSDYNHILSEKRANAVAAELERLGVEAKVLDVKAMAESMPVVPTFANAKEAKNRRVEILFTK